mmetsp:Transcript_34205/g.51287  ORF Transcript_34205/g.51287 Transcript_34205/m.51287 type:complete len:132 (-) Transcript_34205:2598-2993(-)
MSANKMLSKHQLLGNLLRRHHISTQTSSSCIIHKRIIATSGGQQSHHYLAHYFSTTTTTGSETAPFDRSVKLKQRTRAAESCRQHYHYNNTNDVSSSSRPILPYDYFHREIAQRLVDRLDMIFEIRSARSW